MIYIVKPGDTLWKIAAKTNTSIYDLMNYNILCNPNRIFPRELLYVKEPNTQPLVSGRYPYYIVRPGDTLACITYKTGFSNLVDRFYSMNKDRIKDINLIYPGTEFIVTYSGEEDPTYWVNQLLDYFPREYCGDFTKHPIYPYAITWTSFYEETFGEDAIPPIMRLLESDCEALRYAGVLSLGRIAINRPDVLEALNRLTVDKSPVVNNLAQLALQRTELVKSMGKRGHITIKDIDLRLSPVEDSPVIRKYPAGKAFIAHNWFIPYFGNKYNEIYDYIEFLETGEHGFVRIHQVQSGAPMPEALYNPTYYI
jgi:hypothetical protein